MKVIQVSKKDLDLKEWVKRSAKETDYSTLITEPCIVMCDGEVKIIYDILEDDTSHVAKALQKIKYTTGKRSRGLVSTSRIFGYRPRNEMRQDFCSSTSLASEHPKEHEVVASLIEKIENRYAENNPKKYHDHKKLVDEKILPEWRLKKNSVYTSGIINKNNPLKYHFDTGNFTDVYSTMIVFKQDIEGGFLACPEYDIAFALPTNAIIQFDGQGILHGVTPIKQLTKNAYRYSIVYYSLKRMWQCLPISEEIARIRNQKTLRERTRLETPLTEEEAKLKDEKRDQLKNRIGKQ